MISGFGQFCRTFASDRRGGIALIFALSIFVLGGVTGLAIDASRAYSLSQKVGSALDSAALATAKTLTREDATDAVLQERAAALFNNNMSHISVAGVTFSSLAVVADRANSTVEVSVVVHMPTSFARIVNFESFDFPKTSTVSYETKRIELAMVLDITGSMCNPCDKLSGLKSAANEVVDTLGSIAEYPGQIRIGIVPYSASVNAGPYWYTVTGESSGDDTCVVERPGGPPTESTPGSGGWLGTSSVATNTHYSCPASRVVPLVDLFSSSTRDQLKGDINALSAIGGTAGHLGLAWGWYMVSPSWQSIWPSSSRPKPYDPENVIKAVILMTDGDFNTSYLASGTNSTDRETTGSSPNQALALCQAMKARNVRVYTVAFQSSGAAETLMQDCASSSENAYTADNTSQLKAAFRAIAETLTSMRVAK